MRAFVAICTSDVGDGAAALRRRAQERLIARDWACPVDTPQMAILTRGELAARAIAGGEAWILGEVFHRTSGRPWTADTTRERGGGPVAVSQQLCARAFGGYVVVFAPRGRHGVALFRDPTGALEAHLWEEGPLTFAASSLARLELAALAPRAHASSARLGDMLADPTEAFGESLLEHVVATAPGTVLRMTPDGPVRDVVWTPARIAVDASDVADGDPARAAGYARDLATLVDRSVEAYAESAGRCIVEISGGVDSAIVATSMARRGVAAVAAWPTYVSSEPGADERRYAAAVADRIGVALTEIRKRPLTLETSWLEALSPGARPGLNAGDPDYDAALCALADVTRADAVLTGQGGDTVFWTRRTPLAAGPLVRRLGLRALRDPRVHAMALWTRRSVWAVYAANRAEMRRSAAESAALSPAHPDLQRPGAVALPHPWLRDLEGVDPAKRLQIEEVAQCLRLQAECPRAARLRQVHPLLAQPVVEFSLRTPTLSLLQGDRDRGLARFAFGDRLPPEIVGRRGKGDLTAYYARTLARSLAVVRPFLLDGALAERGLLDRRKLEDMLTVDALILNAPTPDLMDLLAIESWARRWARGSVA